MNTLQLFIVRFSSVPLVVACLVGLVQYRKYEATRRYLV